MLITMTTLVPHSTIPVGLKEFAKWMRVQAKKEHAHAVKIYKFVLVRGGRVTLETIEAPKAKWTSPGKVFEESYAHEQKVTGYINSLIDPATKENDHATFEFMQWFFKKSGGRGKCTRHPLPDHNCQRYHRASLLP